MVLVEGVLAKHPELRAGLPEVPEAGLSRSAKLALLDHIAKAVGEQAIFEAAEILPTLGDPFVEVFRHSDSARVVLDKLERWLRFVHSRHRERAVRLDKKQLVLDHVSAAPEPPSRLETLFSTGLVLHLLRDVGYEDLELSFPSSERPEQRAFQGGRHGAPPPGDLTRRRFSWSRLPPRSVPLEPAPSDSPPITRAVEALVLEDPSRRWRLESVAKTLGRSNRSLQRDLAEEGQTFSSVVEYARLDLVCKHLAAERCSITEIAYLCGFSDSAHLARRFRARFEASPTEWREA